MMKSKGNFIDGQWETVRSAEGKIERENPADPDQTVFRTSWDIVSSNRAVQRARAALPQWDRLGVDGRLDYLERLKAAFEDRREDIAQAITREVGKPLWEARGEAGALAKKIDIMCGEALSLTGTHRPDGMDNGHWQHRPLGVLAVLGPYNFPAHLPNGHIIPALINGNTVVVKPSELAGGVMQIYFECLQEAGFPDGVVNLVQGPGAVGKALATHRGVNGVLFTGSWKTGLRIKEQTLDHYWKLLALEMGGKNTSIVLEDADLDQAAHQIAKAAYLTTGQRCSATSRVVLRAEIVDEFIDRFRQLTDRVTVGPPTDGEPFMGPLASKPALETFLEAQQRDESGTLEPVIRGGRAESMADGDGYYVDPAVWLARDVDARGAHQASEIFGPDVVLYPVETDQAATHVANATEYGLAMSVFTADEERFEEMAYDLKSGVLNLNRSTAGASSRLPFGGVKKSGNHRPSAVLAGQYCTYPQAQLREEAGWDDDQSDEMPFSLLQPND
jgi:succinylglutamic semialdehyde dehydrogenase